MEKFMLNITASSGEFYQGDCESLVMDTKYEEEKQHA